MEEGFPILVMYHANTNERVVYKGDRHEKHTENNNILNSLLLGKRDFELVVQFIETGKFEPFEYELDLDDEMGEDETDEESTEKETDEEDDSEGEVEPDADKDNNLRKTEL